MHNLSSSETIGERDRAGLRRLLVCVAGIVLVATSCGAASTPTAEGAQAVVGSAAIDDGAATPDERAAANIDLLKTNDNPFDIEILDVADGQIQTLRTAVDGDRPVLLWFWAPH